MFAAENWIVANQWVTKTSMAVLRSCPSFVPFLSSVCPFLIGQNHDLEKSKSIYIVTKSHAHVCVHVCVCAHVRGSLYQSQRGGGRAWETEGCGETRRFGFDSAGRTVPGRQADPKGLAKTEALSFLGHPNTETEGRQGGRRPAVGAVWRAAARRLACHSSFGAPVIGGERPWPAMNAIAPDGSPRGGRGIEAFKADPQT